MSNDYEDIPSLIDNITAALVKKLDAAKFEIMNNRIKELGLPPVDLEQLRRKRFKNICTEIGFGWENFYLDDGSERGRLIVSFSTNDFNIQPMSEVTGEYSMKSVLKYKYYDQK